MQEVEALVVGKQRIGAMLEQQVDDVVVASFRGPQDWRCNGVSSFRIDRGAVLDEEVAQSVVIVNCSPLLGYPSA